MIDERTFFPVSSKTLAQVNRDNAQKHGLRQVHDSGEQGEPEVRGFAQTTVKNVNSRSELLSALRHKFEPNVSNSILIKVANEIWRETLPAE